MRCRKVQELLKSDYLDCQVKQSEERLVKDHLAHCAQCRKLEEELLEQRVFLKNAKRMAVPEGLWQNIRQNIINEELEQASGILERLRDYLFAPRRVFVLASALTAVIFAMVFFNLTLQNKQIAGKLDNADSYAAVYSLSGENEGSFYNLGTNIEEYFL